MPVCRPSEAQSRRRYSPHSGCPRQSQIPRTGRRRPTRQLILTVVFERMSANGDQETIRTGFAASYFGLKVTRNRHGLVSVLVQNQGYELKAAYRCLAIAAIITAAGTKINCANKVPAIRVPASQTTARRKAASLVRPSTTSSVIIDRCGSMNTNKTMVANPLITDDNVLAVTRNSGFSDPA
jgi:hypothetical protein